MVIFAVEAVKRTPALQPSEVKHCSQAQLRSSTGISSAASKRERSRARRSVDMDNDVNDDEYNSEFILSANQLLQGKNLFDLVTNKDVFSK